MKKTSLGSLIIILIGISIVLLWVIVRLNTPKFIDYEITTHSFGQLSGLIGMTLFALTFVLTTRIKKIENMFNGLDKMYKIHHTMGVISFILILFHPVLLV
ncbi:MAG: ferric reductase-like transmembrane domain-containing protein, partial [Proteobacteria bacterium]|nr:ferric reductase-like transmembrane domain-containing protein [Pseudomonadota bacterium]